MKKLSSVMLLRTLRTVVFCIAFIQIFAQGVFAQETAEKSIRAVLDEQVQAWNAGNTTAFMNGYWNSDSLRFASGGSVRRGWKITLERYQKSYPDKAAMGTLTFSELEITLLSSDAAIVFGKWRLQRAKDNPGGLFTLTFRKVSSGWKIIHDHTSSEN